MPAILDLSPDELLSTTRAVRKRLDLDRPVEPELVRECIELAAQAPTGSNAQGWHFVVVTDPAKRSKLAEYYREGWNTFYGGGADAVVQSMGDVEQSYQETTRRVISSAAYLAEHIAKVPVHVIPCVEGRFESGPVLLQASIWGSLLPAAWSFCLAARARGLGTCWTTLHLIREQEAAELLGIPDNVAQGALIPVAHVKGGTDFNPGPRRDLSRVIHTEAW
jgi:nitroreductase